MSARKRNSDEQAGLPLDDEKGSHAATESARAAVVGEPAPSRSVTRLPARSRAGIYLRQQEFFIPVHGLVRLTPSEVELVNHPAFQRLSGVYQLGQTHLVYRGATHRRLEHCLGTLHVAQLMIDAVERNSGPVPPDPDDRVGDWALGGLPGDEERAFIRLGALLHDVGHLPAGHTFEDELGLLGPHDGDRRLELVLDRETWRGVSYRPTLRELIDQLYASEAQAAGLTDAEGKRALTASEILCILISKDKLNHQRSSLAMFRLDVCRDIIGNTICADLLDYLHRDWLHVGKGRYFDTRLFEYMEIRFREGPGGPESHLVINLRSGKKIRTDAVTAILDLLEGRYQLFEIALFHRTKLCAAGMLERAVAELADAHHRGRATFLRELPEFLLDRSDEEMLSFLKDEVEKAIAELQSRRKPQQSARLAGVRSLLDNLRIRRLHKEVRTAFEYNLADVALDVQNHYAGPRSIEDRRKRAEEGARNRLAAVRLLEQDFGLPPCSIVMYCPPREMSTKIAEVEVLVHGHVHTLDSFEQEHGDRGVTGGHLKAQKERFRRLWRVLFAIDREQRDSLEEANMLQALGQAIDLCVLRVPPSIGTIEDAVRSLAKELTTREASPLYEGDLVTKTAARSDSYLAYPGGAPSLTSCIELPKP
jgi:HD superfamily phosphohydrolase